MQDFGSLAAPGSVARIVKPPMRGSCAGFMCLGPHVGSARALRSRPPVSSIVPAARLRFSDFGSASSDTGVQQAVLRKRGSDRRIACRVRFGAPLARRQFRTARGRSFHWSNA